MTHKFSLHTALGIMYCQVMCATNAYKKKNKMEIKGKIIQVFPPQGGVSKQGNAWRKQEFVLETLDSYPKQVKFDLFGDRIDQYPLAVGDIATVSYDIESREFNGRWYTDIHAYKAIVDMPQPIDINDDSRFE